MIARRTCLLLLALVHAAAPSDTEEVDLICSFYDAYKESLEDAEEHCSCDGFVTCFMPERCGEVDELPQDVELESIDVDEARAAAPTGTQCATDLSLNISLSDTGGLVVVQACGTYATQEFARTCIATAGPFNPTQPSVTECYNATYDGQLCSCSVCEAGQGLNVDCTDHHVNATTNGCQIYNANDMNTLLPAFGQEPIAVDDADETPEAEPTEEPTEASASPTIQKFGAIMVISSVFASTMFL